MKKEYWIHVKHVDNRLVIFFNGETIWDSGIVHDDPELNAYINVTDHMLQTINHASELVFEGFNDTYGAEGDDALNPWHFEYRVYARVVNADGQVVSEADMLAPYNEKHVSNPNTKAINNSYRIVRKDNEFKVVANSLQQNFYN